MTIFTRAYLIAHMLILFPLLTFGALSLHWIVFFVFTQVWHNTYLDNGDLIMDFLLVHHFLTKKDCQPASLKLISSGTDSADLRDVQNIDLNYTTYGWIALRIVDI